jgi:hypothetical protein
MKLSTKLIPAGFMSRYMARYSAIAWLLLAATCLSTRSHADVVIDWNSRADAIAAEKRVSGPAHGRGLAIMHVAMFEALNAIDRRYLAYRLDLVADRNTSREAAAAAAGHAVLTALYPDQRASLDELLARHLASVEDGPPKERGLILGRKAAAALLEWRTRDGWDAPDTWRPVTQPGVYVATSPVASFTVGTWTPWVLESPAQFRPGPPPALNSPTWTRDVNEIHDVGGLVSRMRSDDQTTAAKFWFVTGARAWNPMVAQVAAHRRMDLLDCARLFALTSLAGMDAYIAVFEAKFQYNFWRPVTAIRNGDVTGNPATPRDASWVPLGDTPMHPEYPCAHCITSAAVAAVLRGVVGDDVGDLSMSSPTAGGVTRRWATLQAYEEEVSNARIWGGFHYRFSTEVGRDMGRKIGELTLATQLRPRTRS